MPATNTQYIKFVDQLKKYKEKGVNLPQELIERIINDIDDDNRYSDDTYDNFDSEDWEFYEEEKRKVDYKWALITELDRTHDGWATPFHSMLFFNLYNACCQFYNIDFLDFI